MKYIITLISETCYCDGTEDFKCDKIKSNMDALCFKENEEDILSNEIGVDKLKSQKSSSSSFKQKIERFLIIMVVFVQLFVAYVSASIQVMVSSFESDTGQADYDVAPMIER